MVKYKKPSFFAVDFFCGAGGTTCGLIDAGGYVISGIDKESACQDTYCKNNKNKSLDCSMVKYLSRDIFPKSKEYPEGQQDLIFKELKNLILPYRERYKEIPLLFAICAPCQPFTNLSKNKLTQNCLEKHKRDQGLLSEAIKFVNEFEPELILSENVAGIGDQKYGNVWENFQSKLDESGYVTGTKVVCTSRFGVPQYRRRSILIAVKKTKVNEFRIDMANGGKLIVPQVDPDTTMISVKEAIGHLPILEAGVTNEKIANHLTRKLSPLNSKRLSCAKPGESNRYLENTKYGDLSLECHKRANSRHNSRCFGDVYTRMHPNRPSPTITTKCLSITNGRFGHFDQKQIRGISLREAATLQSFPEDYTFYPTNNLGSVAKMIGNAVPPKLASFFANYLVNSLKPIEKIKKGS